MARLDHDALVAALAASVGATPDASGVADVVFERGYIVIAAEVSELKGAFKRAKKIDGYRWVAINREDLFGANPLSLGSKVGILDADGRVLKNADSPRRKV
ncbi:hypothetical protein [Candidatus Poriferisodalis sp.]|uniref:hypothetical protein n=1 Tax=Candidatus Poriferisodalis sp. TaxID=3101277 RepID=UPI003B01E5EC